MKYDILLNNDQIIDMLFCETFLPCKNLFLDKSIVYLQIQIQNNNDNKTVYFSQ